jgi:alpha-glucoside transport system substrate-binding protein
MKYLLVSLVISWLFVSAQTLDPKAAALEAAGGEAIGGTVSMLGVLGGAELEAFLSVMKPFEEATGITVEYESTRDLGAVLQTRVDGGNPPDLVSTPAIGQMSEFAAAGKLLDLSQVLNVETIKQDFGEGLVEVTSRDGKLFGIFDAVNLGGLVWYNAKAYTGPNPPASWDELQAWASETANAGTTPWCMGLESGPASGWPGANMITELVLRQSGPEIYNQWWQGQLPWSSPEIKRAFETYGSIATDPKMVNGGATAVLATGFMNGADGLFAHSPTCYLHDQANFMGGIISGNFPDLKPEEDIAFFPLPDFNPDYTNIRQVSGEIVGVFNDTPQSRALVKYLATPEAQSLIAETGIWLAANKRVPLESYPSPFTRKAAEALATGNTYYYGNALMPQAMSDAFWKSVLDYMQNPGNLDTILAELDRVQQESYQ